MADNLKKGIRPCLRKIIGAGNGARTRDPKLGKLVLYQLSYARPTKFSEFWPRGLPHRATMRHITSYIPVHD
jgi:hypothetical protein